MSTAVVLNLPERGHMNATFPVVAELVRVGERVVYFATEPYRAEIEKTGAQFVSYGDHAAFAPPAHRGGLFSVMAYLTTLAESVLPSVLERVREEHPDYLLVDSMCIWGSYVRQVLRKPAVTLGSVFVPNEELISDEELVRQAYGQATKETILAAMEALDSYLCTTRRIDREYGTASPNLVGFFANRQPLNILFTSRHFHLDGQRFDADRYAFVGPSIDRRRAEAPLPFEIPAGRPLIYISLGTIFNEQLDFYRTCFEALGEGAYEVVLAIGERIDAQALGSAPDNFIVRASVPQLAVLRHASLFLTHGGMNSTNEALWHGVPLIVYPRHGDQHLVAGRVVELGAGERLEHGADARTIRALIDHIVREPRYAEAAVRIGQTLRSGGGPGRAAELIARFAREAAA